MKTAKDIMTTKVITVTPDLLVEELAALLLKNSISGVPVVDADGHLLAVVSESDLIDQEKNIHIPTVVSILDSFMFLENPDKMDKELKKMTGRRVKDICSYNPITVTENTPLNEIATIMSEKKFHTLPVLANGELTGVVGKSDLIKLMVM